MIKLKTSIFISVFLCLASFVNADILYNVKDFGTLSAEKSEARSLNDNGWVVGKYFLQEQIIDFLWSPEDGLKVLTQEADKQIFPKINNIGLATGFNFKPGSWLSSAQLQRYTYNPDGTTTDTKWFDRHEGVTIVDMNDTYIILVNHTDITKTTYSYFFNKEKLVAFDPLFTREQLAPTAINNHNKILITYSSSGLFGSSLLATYELCIYDIATDSYEIISDDKLYYGVGLNDSHLIIARNAKGTEGFYGSKELGMISLGNFVPTALNNHVDMVGKKDKSLFLRKMDGTMIDLNEVIDRKETGIGKIVEVWDINDKGQILVTAQIEGKNHAFLLEPLQ